LTRWSDRWIFSGRGAVAPRDHTVTGIRNLQLTPLEHPGWQFELAFQEQSTGVIIHDRADLVWDHHRRTFRGGHPLALNFGSDLGADDFMPPLDGSPAGPGQLRSLISQRAEWHPNDYRRWGTFHKRILGRQISFAITSRTTVDAVGDGVFLEVTIRNRTDEPLALSTVAHQRVLLHALADYRRDDVSEQIDSRTILSPVSQWPGGRAARTDRFVSQVSSDLPATEQGWLLEVPARGETTALFRIDVRAADQPSTGNGSLRERLDTSDTAYARLHDTFMERLPRVGGSPALAEFHLRCAHTLFEARWVRPDWQNSPFYSAGTWLATLAWDVSFASALIALLEPEALTQSILYMTEAGLTQHSYLVWDGMRGPHYSYTLFALIRALRDLIDVAGRPDVLDAELASGLTLHRELLDRAIEILETNRDAVGLISFGDEASAYNENRTDGHQGGVAVLNLVAIDTLTWLAGLPQTAPDDRDRLLTEARVLRDALDTLWDEGAAWFRNRYSDGSTDALFSYQMYDALRSTGLGESEREGILTHLREGAFLGPHGMYSVSREDEIHFDQDDADWGGGGQYSGMPLRIAQDLFAIGRADLGWDVLERCVTWNQAFPYIPQEVMADSLATLDVEQAVEVAAGAGVQAIVFGVFGISPKPDGTLIIAPVFDERSVGLDLEGYRHGTLTVSVALGASGFAVVSGQTRYEALYGESVTVR
jgi:hypothetical protein